jgi:hypothetical protein
MWDWGWWGERPGSENRDQIASEDFFNVKAEPFGLCYWHVYLARFNVGMPMNHTFLLEEGLCKA